jgi:hypothetical protein
MRRTGCAAALAVASWLWLAPALAADVVLDDGSTIAGRIVHGTRNTITIRPVLGGLRQVPIGRIERIEVTGADGRTRLVGRYRGWADGRSVVEVGTELLWLEDDRVVARQPLTTRALATAPAANPDGAVAERVPAASPRADSGASAAAEPAWRAAAVTAPLPPPLAAEARAARAPEPAAGPATATGPAMAALPAGDLPVVSIRTSPDDVNEKSGTLAFTVELSRPADDLLVVIYSTVDGAARSGADYEPLQGILTMPAGVTSSEIRTRIIDDGDREGDEEFQLFLASNPDLATIVEPWTKITIHDDD